MKRAIGWVAVWLGVILGANAQDISPFLFGQNHWLADNDEGRVGYLHLLWPKVEASGVKLVRIGGNGYNHHLPERGQLSAMIDSIRHIGAEPLLQVPDRFTAIQAMELVEFFTKIGERRVRYWCIGNEPLLNREFTIDQVQATILRLAPAMKKVDSTIKILVFDECELREPAYRDLCGGRLDITGLQENGAWLIDGFSFHKYPNGRDFSRDDVVFSGPETIRRQARALVQMMGEADQKHHRRGGAKLMWGLTEVNVTYANPDREISGFGNPSFLGGQFMAEIFGIGMEYGAFTVNPWCISETDAVSTDFGYLGMPREFYPRSSYYHMQMMANHMKGRYLPSAANRRTVKSVCSKDRDQICVMILNEDQTHDFDYDVVLNTNGRSEKPLVVTADAGLDVKLGGVLPNQTTVLLVLDGAGKTMKQVTYSLAANLKNQAPEVKTFE
jgi:hypothetical protein